MPSFLLQTKANVLTALMQTVECHSRRLQGWRKWHGSFFSMTTTKLRILWVFRLVVCCYFIDRTPPPLLFLKRPNDDFLPNFWQGSHWRQSVALDDYNFFAKMKKEMSHLLTLVARTLDENNLEMLVWMEIIFTCKQYFPDWSTLMCKLRIKWLFGRLSFW